MGALGAASAEAATFDVTRADDPAPNGCAVGDCSLREAVITANVAPDNDTINLPAGTYALTIDGAGEDAAATGDLDITPSATSGLLTIAGAGAATTIVDAALITDRVFHVLDGARASFSSLTIQDGTGTPAGIYNDDNSATPAATTTAITGSAVLSGNAGRGVENDGAGVVTVASTTIDGNAGGGVFNEETATMTISGSAITNNDAGASDGAGVFNQNDATMTITGTTITGNEGSRGPGVFNQNDAVLTIAATDISNNIASNDGGGIFNQNQAVLTIGTSTISGNDSDTDGGGIYNNNQAQLTIDSSTISGNDAASDGGALFAQNQSVFSATNTTISGNGPAVRGGAAFANNQATIVLRNSTITGNSASVAGGGFFDGTFPAAPPNDPPYFIFSGALVTANTVGAATANCVIGAPANFSSQGDNLEDTNSCGFAAAGDIPNGTANLGPLANNGGPTSTHALLPGSQALDTVDAACPPPATDQRGVARPQGPACDIGAFEVLTATTPPDVPPAEDPPDTTPPAITIKTSGGKLRLNKRSKPGKLNLNPRGKGIVVIGCPVEEQTPPCSGRFKLRTLDKIAAKKGAKEQRLTLAKSSFSLDAGEKQRFRLQLSKAHLELVEDDRAARKAELTATVFDAAGNSGKVAADVNLNPA